MIDPAFLPSVAGGSPSPAVIDETTIDEVRASSDRVLEERWAAFGAPIPAVDVTEVVIPVEGTDCVGTEVADVRVRIHRPPHSDAPLPTLITFYGGAFRQGSNDISVNRWMHAHRAIEANIVVVAVDYARSPEHRFRTPVTQGLAVLDHVAAHAHEFGIDAERIAVGGQSSGGNIAAALAQANLDRGGPRIRLQVLEVPVLDLTGGHLDLAVLDELGLPRELALDDRERVASLYLARRVDAADPEVSPLLRENLGGLPEAFLIAAENDPLRGDAVAYHRRLREAGALSTAIVSYGQLHDSNPYVRAAASSRAWQRDVVGALRTLHDRA